MSTIRFHRSLIPLLALLAGACSGCPSCAKETLQMTTETAARSAAARDVFAEPGAGELAQAVADGDRERIARLAPQANLAARGRDDVTLLQWAVLHRQPRALQALLDAGADPAQQGLDGETVLHMAAQADDSVYLKTLLAHGADANAPARNKANALVSALDAARPEHVRMLLDAGANPSQPDQVGYTPLHAAAMLRDFDSVLLLLERGADPRARSGNGASFQDFVFVSNKRVPLNDQAKRGQQAIAAWLRAHDIPVEGAPQ